MVTFGGAHSLFHEFGHAINHLLLVKRRPGESGLDHLPVERIEELASWFENWVYHPDLAGHLDVRQPDQDGLLLGQQVKALEFSLTAVERVAVSLLDFEVNRRQDGTLRDAFRRLDDEFALSRYCDFGALLEHFTWPMFRAHPGANFTYLWGAADGAQRFDALLSRRLEEIALAEFDGAFRPCLDPDAPGTVPDVGVLFDFHDGQRLARSATREPR